MSLIEEKKYNNINFITAEKIELKCDLILGIERVFYENPYIFQNHTKV